MRRQAADDDRLVALVPAAEQGGRDQQRRAVFHREQVPEQVDVLRVGPEVRLVAAGHDVAVALAPTERAAGLVDVGAEVVERAVGLAAKDVADAPSPRRCTASSRPAPSENSPPPHVWLICSILRQVAVSIGSCGSRARHGQSRQ